MADRDLKDYFERRKGAMKTERSSFISHYKELSRFIQPRRGRFFLNDRNKGDRRFQHIINSHATQAHRIARAGLLAGVMSPARPWFALETPDREMMKFPPVKIWLQNVEFLLRSIFNASNLYTMAPVLLGELLLFGTGAMTQVDDFQDVSRFYTHTAGSYYISQDNRYEVTTFGREFEMTAGQMEKEFGKEKLSMATRQLLFNKNPDAWVPVTQFIEPNPDADMSRIGSKFKPFRSGLYEPGKTEPGDLLSLKGFDEFPTYVPRWDVTAEDIYGTDSPAMVALGDIKGLQIEEKRKAQAIDKSVNPPLTGPASFKSIPVSSLPGGLSLADTGTSGQGLRPVYMVNPGLQDLSLDIQRVERRIDAAFYVDLFMAITRMQGVQPRNEQELAERNAERLLQIGPVLERVQNELLGRIIDRTFNQAARSGILPPAPPELVNIPLEVTYISTLAMAQRSVATSDITDLFNFGAGLVGSGFEQALDKLDPDQAIEEYARLIGAPARLVVPDDIVQQKRQAQAQAQQRAEAAAMATQAANAAKMASDAKLNDDSVLSRATQAAGAT